MITIDEAETLVRRQMRGKISKDIVIRADTELRDLGLSSLQITEVVFGLEEQHGIEFDTERAAQARTLGDLIQLGNETIAASQRTGTEG